MSWAEWKGKGKGKGKGWGKWSQAPVQWTVADWHVPGFAEALSEALSPYAGTETNITDLENRIGQKMVKAAKKYSNDERRNEYGSSSMAQTLVEEFINDSMSAIASSMYEKPWWTEANFTGPHLALALFCFDGAKVFRRTVGPMIEKFVEAGIFKFREEERIQRVMGEAVDSAPVKENYKKKTLKHLGAAYDEAHLKSPYGQIPDETVEMALLKAFIKGWMTDFVARAWDVLENGIGQGEGTSRDEKVLFVTVLFQALANGVDPCLPYDLTSVVVEVPPGPWAYVAEAAETVFQEMEVQSEVHRVKRAKLW